MLFSEGLYPTVKVLGPYFYRLGSFRDTWGEWNLDL